jgi:rhamnogalacturonan endolyase
MFQDWLVDFVLPSTTAEPSVGELRFIARLKHSALSAGYPQSYTIGATAIEGSDVFTVNGITTSKFYSSRQFIDDQVHGVSGSNIGAYIVIPGVGYEGSSGGPFFRDINNQNGMCAHSPCLTHPNYCHRRC